ncbi:MAG: ribose-phosphate pyrophosphokinase [Legionellales bacterium]|nr:ribose-phosphate pyrophosphokinase [Legionellales bacterium]
MPEMMVFGGNAHPQLTQAIANHLQIPVGKARVDRFCDGEIDIEILVNVRGHDIFIIQPTCTPTNDNLMELVLLADALRRSSAARITAVVPYYGYARQDRRIRSARVPISAKIVADLMASVGISRMVTVDLHADQIQGFFYMPVDNVYGTPVMFEDIKQKNYQDLLVVSPDVGGVVRARAIAKRLNNTELAIIDKRRPRANESVVMNIIGDVAGRNCLLVDDIVDTAGTLCHAADALKKHGAASVAAYVTHPVLSGKALENLSQSTLDELVVTDTIPLSEAALQHPKIRCLSLSTMLAKTIRRVNEEESVSEMFLD